MIEPDHAGRKRRILASWSERGTFPEARARAALCPVSWWGGKCSGGREWEAKQKTELDNGENNSIREMERTTASGRNADRNQKRELIVCARSFGCEREGGRER